MPSPASNERPRPRFLLSLGAWLIVAGAFAAGLLLFLAIWMGQRDRSAPAADPAIPTVITDGTSPALPAPQPLDPSDARGMPAPEAAPGQAVGELLPTDAPLEPVAPAMPVPDMAPAPVATTAESAPVAIDTPPPRYPSASLRRGESGEVLLHVRVGANGRPEQVEVVRSSRSRALDRAAVEAVRRWRFQPAMHQGQPVAGTVQIPVMFDPQ